MGLIHIRIDDRLIHGQVLVGWSSCYDYNIYAICDAELAASDWEKEMYLAAVPGEKSGVVLLPGEVEDFVHKHSDENILILLKNLDTLNDLIDSGFAMTKVVIGGLHDKPGRKKYYDYIFLSPEDVNLIKSIASKGVKIVCQDLPEHPAHELANIGK